MAVRPRRVRRRRAVIARDGRISRWPSRAIRSPPSLAQGAWQPEGTPRLGSSGGSQEGGAVRENAVRLRSFKPSPEPTLEPSSAISGSVPLVKHRVGARRLRLASDRPGLPVTTRSSFPPSLAPPVYVMDTLRDRRRCACRTRSAGSSCNLKRVDRGTAEPRRPPWRESFWRPPPPMAAACPDPNDGG
jgi:hypothetical protein